MFKQQLMAINEVEVKSGGIVGAIVAKQRMEKTKYPGVRCRKHPSRRHGVQYDKCFFVRYTLKGGKDQKSQRREEPVGWASEGVTAERASGELAKIKEAIRNGDTVITIAERRQEAQRLRAEEKAEKKAAEKTDVTFNEFYEQVYKINRDEKALVTEQYLYDGWVKPVVGNKKFSTITELDMAKIKRRAIGAGKAYRTVEYAYHVVRVVFGMAKELGYHNRTHPITKNIKQNIKYDNRKTNHLSYEESEELLDALQLRSEMVHDMALLALYCGLRQGEICGLNWGDVDIAGKAIVVRWTVAKNNKKRFVPLVPRVIKMLEEHKRGKKDEPVFVNEKGMRCKSISKTFIRTVEDLGFNKDVIDRLERITFHSLRHTYASWLVQKNQPLINVQKLLGHGSIRTTERYSHVRADYLEDTAAVLSDMGNDEVEENKVVNQKGS